MSRSALVRRVRWCGAVAGAALLGFAGAAQARAVQESFEFHETLSGTTALPECLPADLIGVMSGTEDTFLTILETDATIQARAPTRLNYRVDFPDGSFVIGTATEHFTISTRRTDNPLVSTTTIVEPRTIYDAAGNPIGTAFLHFHGHITAFDANHNGTFEPELGEVTTNFDQLKFTCH
jgi:hypothetical protein